ncbi:MAG TPA: hypothetical protein PLU88_04115 [Armatimonadota bacterium]|nr:hypothetical protein [Armatimonadota bacterium]HOM72194.1 hypothetical protein [Armatimonadota bacterium]HPP74295.1 hypothetical protein [Armatimonadota bacterium]
MFAGFFIDAGTSSLGRLVIIYQVKFPQPNGTSIGYYERYRNIYIDGCSHFCKASIRYYRFYINQVFVWLLIAHSAAWLRELDYARPISWWKSGVPAT